MTRVTIRKSGGANIISIPKAILKLLGLHTDSTVELSVEDNKIILEPVHKEYSLDEILKGSLKSKLVMHEEDSAWCDEKPTGKEE